MITYGQNQVLMGDLAFSTIPLPIRAGDALPVFICWLASKRPEVGWRKEISTFVDSSQHIYDVLFIQATIRYNGFATFVYEQEGSFPYCS
jgi:hypothetical protein